MDRKSLAAGVAVLAIGLFAVLEARGLATGTPSRMGPGFFPMFLGWILVALGLGIATNGFFRRRTNVTGEAPAHQEPDADASSITMRRALRPLTSILLAIVVFAIMIERTGLVPAVLVTVLISTSASQSFSLWRALCLAVAVPIGTFLIFRVGLGLSIPAFDWNL